MNDALKMKTAALNHYKRTDVQEAMIETCRSREAAARFGQGFGKRPDILSYPRDILEFAKQGATSFHVSEERWANPLQLKPQMPKKELNELRIGWDFILDIDSPYWEISKLITRLLISALRKHNIRSVSCKFSGNKGFHIGVPFEAFPEKVGSTETRLWFPDGIRKIAQYLIDYIDSKENDFEFSRKVLAMYDVPTLLSMTGKTYNEMIVSVCQNCEKIIPKKKQVEVEQTISCPYCEAKNKVGSDSHIICRKCKKIFYVSKKKKSSSTITCPKCSGTDTVLKINPTALIDVDTLLISSRHLYRMTYSLHEKSHLVSIPINPDAVDKFTKEMAAPGRRLSRFKFLDTTMTKSNEARELFDRAFESDIEKKESERKQEFFNTVYIKNQPKEYEDIAEAIDPKHFPPCVQKGLLGIKDGKKRFMFILHNFLSSVGWGYEQIEELFIDWNEKNDEPLREVSLKGHLRYHKGKKTLPPNCDNKAYYQDLHICDPDALCKRIKNPVNYAKIKSSSEERENKGRKKKTPKKTTGKEVIIEENNMDNSGQVSNSPTENDTNKLYKDADHEDKISS